MSAPPLFARYLQMDPEILADTSKMYAELHSGSSPFWCERLKAWVVCGYDDVVAVSKDAERFVNGRHGLYRELLADEVYGQVRPLIEMLSMFMGMVDPPIHMRLRGLVHKAFTPRMVERLRPVTERIANELLDGIERRGGRQFDLVAEFAAPLPARVIVDLLAMPETDLVMFKQWATDFSNFVGAAVPTPEAAIQAKRSLVNEAVPYFATLIEQRRLEPGEDLISALVHAHDEDDR